MAIGLLGSMTLQAMAQYTGKVFVDENRNGLLDEGEKRLHRVSVSDGLNVVQTDSNGAYQLPGHSRMHFLFITTPSGYKTDNAYYYRIENGRTEYDFPVYPCYGGNGIRGFINKYSHIGDYPIIGRQGALCGNVNYAQGQFYATEHAVVVSPLIEMNTVWLYYVLNSLKLNEYARGVAQPGISVNIINNITMPIFNINTQIQFAKRIECVESQKQKIKQSIVEVQQLLDYTMNKYFG